MSRQCVVCKKVVANTDVQEHLANNHLGPHYFWFGMKKFRTMEPSMLVADLKKLVGAPMDRYIVQEVSGAEDVCHPDGVAVDLTHEPHFFSMPSATMHRDINV